MGRELKRVPLDFNHPLKKIWPGYEAHHAKDKIEYWKNFKSQYICKECSLVYNNCDEDAPYCLYHPDNKKIWHYHPPTGEGYQLWETTTEGSPVSPVFKTLEELCEWCEENYTVFADFTATKEEWMGLLSNGTVIYRAGHNIFI